MTWSASPSSWASAQFGGQAALVIEGVVAGLIAGQHAAWRVQTAATDEGVTTRRAYVSVWDSRYHYVLENLREVDGLRSFHPHGASYDLPVVNGRLFLPFRHADSLAVPPTAARLTNDVPVRVSREFGVKGQPTLFDDALGDHDRIDDDMPVIYIAYAANAGSERLLGAWWGEATSLDDDGRLTWAPERLPIDRAYGAPQEPAATRAPGFAAGEMPEVPMGLRHTEQLQADAVQEPGGASNDA